MGNYVDELEIIRLKRKKCIKFIVASAVGLFLSIIYLVTFITLYNDKGIGNINVVISTGVPIIVICAVGLFVSIFSFANKEKKYKEVFGQVVISPVLYEFFGNNFKYDSHGINHDTLNSMRLLTNMGSLNSEDAIYGLYKGINFMQADVDLYTTRDDGNGGSEKVTFYVGQVMRYEWKKPVNGRVYIYSNKLLYHDSKLKGLSKIKTESEDFNKLYTVYATDAHDAFYVLTPQFMERISQIYAGAIFKALNIEGGCINVAYAGDYSNLDNDLSVQTDVETAKIKIRQDMYRMLGIIDALNLAMDNSYERVIHDEYIKSEGRTDELKSY